MTPYLGTSGYSYPEWKGSFYPDKIPSKEMLNFYATRLNSVEINNTFYRLPRQSVIEGWAGQVGDDFLFTVKASRRITHFKKLTDTKELLAYLLKGLSGFGSKLGPVLFQLPPTLKADATLLANFLRDVEAVRGEQLAADTKLRLAFEFRHPTWFLEETYQILEEHNAALVGGDLDESTKDPPLVKTASHLYLRLRKTDYQPGEVARWADRIRELNVDEVFAYFKHEELGPALALELMSLLQAEVESSTAKPAGQSPKGPSHPSTKLAPQESTRKRKTKS